jgi:hypothetical protein
MEKLPDKNENLYWSFRQAANRSTGYALLILPDKNENSYWLFRQPIAAQDKY